MAFPSLPCAVNRLVPHRGPMLLLDSLVVFEEERARAQTMLGPDCLFCRGDDSLHPAIAAELFAQTAAAHEGYRRLSQGAAPEIGYLAGVRNLVVSGTLPCDEKLTIDISEGPGLGALSTISGSVSQDVQVLARGELVLHKGGGIGVQIQTSENSVRGSSSVSLFAALEEALVLQSRSGENAVFKFVVNEGFPAFQGHFPGAPVLPGVVSIVAAEAMVRCVAPSVFEVGVVKKAKFRRPAMPGTELCGRLSARVDKSGADCWRVDLSDGDAIVAEIQLCNASPLEHRSAVCG